MATAADLLHFRLVKGMQGDPSSRWGFDSIDTI